jgi:FkbM family methyltransferase
MRWLTKPPSKWWRRYNRVNKALFGHRQTARTYFGAKMVLDLDDYIGIRLYHFGFWEPHISGLLQSRLHPGDVFCDIGANIGYDTLLAAHAVGPSGTVIAIEPYRPFFETLSHHVALNRLTNVRLVQAAVAERAGTIAIFHGPDGNTGMTTTVAARGKGDAGVVDALTLETILTPDEIARLKLIKIDIEGAEGPVLRHLLDTIELYPRDLEILVEMGADALSPDSPSADDTIARFIAAGFGAYALPNEYDIQSYVAFERLAEPTPLSLPLTVQTDVLFSRTKI